MDDRHKRMPGLTGVILLGALAVGAAGPDELPKPAHTAILDVPRLQVLSAESVGPIPANGSEDLPAKTTLGCAGIVVGATELMFSDGFETGDTGAWGPGALARFSAIRMLDLNLTVRFVDGFAGDHLLHLRLFTPKGHHYQTLSVPIASDPVPLKGERPIGGYPRPVAVRLIQKAGSPSLPEVTLSVPVGGTPIVSNSIYGMWTAEAFLDDQSEFCASQPFFLVP